jgi:hypothetical protein
MKVKVDAELWEALVYDAGVMQLKLLSEERAHEATKKAYLLLTAAHDASLLVATEWVTRPTIVQADVSLQIEIDSLEERLREAQEKR